MKTIRLAIIWMLLLNTTAYACEECEQLGMPHVEHVPDFSQDGDAIIIESGQSLEVYDELRFSTLVVQEGGRLVLRPGAELVVMDTTLDRELDPEHIGNGLIILGELHLEGTPKTPFVRASTGIPAGATTATFQSEPEGWKVGDRLAIPDTRQRPQGSVRASHTEIVTITDVCGDSLTFTPTQYDHPAGTHEWMTPHVANLTRDIVIRSENPGGMRGHSMFMGKSRITGGWAEIRDFGRTDATRIHNSTVTSTGYIHYGTNQNGRYPWHWHLMRGWGKYSSVEGLVIDGSKKWNMTIHGTNDVMVSDCIGIGAIGAAFVTEDATERGNTYQRCFAINAANGHNGKRPQPLAANVGLDIARDGSGFWLRGPMNNVIDCIAADVEERGLSMNGMGVSGVDPDFAGEIRGVETYASGDAIWFREHSGGVNRAAQARYPRVTAVDCVGWSLSNSGAYIYRTGPVTVENSRFYADPVVSQQNPGFSKWFDNSVLAGTSAGVKLEAAYAKSSIVLRSIESHGFNIGIHPPSNQFTNLDGKHEIGFLIDGCVVSAPIQIYVPATVTLAPVRMDNITFIPTDAQPIQPATEQVNVWMSIEGRIIGTRRTDVTINGERYWFHDEPGEGREQREGVIGFVSQELE